MRTVYQCAVCMQPFADMREAENHLLEKHQAEVALAHACTPPTPKGVDEVAELAKWIVGLVQSYGVQWQSVTHPMEVRTKVRERIASALTQARLEAIEECAKVAEDPDSGRFYVHIAAAIRALKERTGG